jgi:DNA-binding NtrC family response regulator
VPTRVDVRVIAATNRDLAAEVRAGRFRADLYYRIAVAEVTMPPLRAHAEDIGAIARHLLAGRASGQGGGMRPRAIEDAALARLAAHDWPGNVRELRNVLEAAAATAEGGTIRARDLPAHFDRVVLRGEDLAPPGAGLAARGGRERGTERARLLAALRAAGGNKSLAAAALRCSRMTLYRRLARCGLDGAAEDAPGAPRPG